MGALTVARPRVTVTRTTSADGKYTWHHLTLSKSPAVHLPSVLFPTISMQTAAQGTGPITDADVRWCATIHPSDLEPFFATGASTIGNNLDWWQAQWSDRAYLEPLLGLRTSFSEMAVRLVTLAMASKEPGIRGLATDVTAQALADGRLPVATFGDSLGYWWASPLTTPRRFALALASAAAASAATRSLIRQAMTVALHHPPHTDAAPILELLHELSHADRAAITDPLTRAALTAYPSGKAARLAKSLLQLDYAGLAGN